MVFTEHLLCASAGSHMCPAPRIQELQVTLPGLGRERAGEGSKAKASVRENRSTDPCRLSQELTGRAYETMHQGIWTLLLLTICRSSGKMPMASGFQLERRPVLLIPGMKWNIAGL